MEEQKTEKRPDVDLLQSVLHNSEIGIVAINYILPEVESKSLKETFKNQKKKFLEITNEAKELGFNFNITLKPNNCFKKCKMWLSIKTSSFFDDDTQHLAELMIFGHFMGTINMIKSLADASEAKNEILNVARKLKKVEEDSINELVPFLEKTKE